MATDKYTALWVSYSSISDFKNCPRAYFLKNIYRDPKTGHKIKLVNPPLSLGQTVHEVVESLSVLPVEQRFKDSLIDKFDLTWNKVSGEKGGFTNKETEKKYKDRGKKMLERIIKNPGPLINLAVKIKMDLPYFWISEKDNIILCGKIDWLEYLPHSDRVNIIDFKTGKYDEKADSLQLPIYYLITTNCQKHKVEKASYWYIERNDKPTEQSLPDLQDAHNKVLEIAKKIKLTRQLRKFNCPHTNGCSFCRPYEAIIQGKAEFVGINEYKNDLYILDKPLDSKTEKKSSIL